MFQKFAFESTESVAIRPRFFPPHEHVPLLVDLNWYSFGGIKKFNNLWHLSRHLSEHHLIPCHPLSSFLFSLIFLLRREIRFSFYIFSQILHVLGVWGIFPLRNNTSLFRDFHKHFRNMFFFCFREMISTGNSYILKKWQRPNWFMMFIKKQIFYFLFIRYDTKNKIITDRVKSFCDLIFFIFLIFFRRTSIRNTFRFKNIHLSPALVLI